MGVKGVREIDLRTDDARAFYVLLARIIHAASKRHHSLKRGKGFGASGHLSLRHCSKSLPRPD
jgi:hypothetical protein